MFDIGLSQDDLYKDLISIGMQNNSVVYDADARKGVLTSELINLMKLRGRRHYTYKRDITNVNAIFVPSSKDKSFHYFKEFLNVKIHPLDSLRLEGSYHNYYLQEIDKQIDLSYQPCEFYRRPEIKGFPSGDKYLCFGLDINNPLGGVILGSF